MEEGNEKAAHLKREISLLGSFSMGFADVGADVFVAIGLVATYAAGFSPLAFLLASICYITTGLVYSELTTLYPYAGGAQIYGMRAKGDLIGFLAGWAIMLDYVLDIGLFSIASAGYLSFLLPQVSSEINLFSFKVNSIGLTAFLIVISLIIINILGIRESSLLNQMLVVSTLAIEVIVLFLGFLFVFNLEKFIVNFSQFGSPFKHPEVFYVGFSDLKTENMVYGVTLAMSSFIGIESIAQAAEETKNPARHIPKAFKSSIVAVVFFTLSFSILGLGVLGWKGLSKAVYNPIAQITVMVPGLGWFLSKIVALVAFAICIVSTNTGVIGVSRVTYSMSKYSLFPSWFSKLHRVRATPVRSIIIFGFIGGLLAFIGKIEFVASLYNYGAILSYVFVNFSHIALRKIDREAYKPWKTPLNVRLGDREISITALMGLTSTLTMFTLILMYHPDGRLLGTCWMAVGTLVYILLRKHLGLPVTGRFSAEKVKPSIPMLNTGVYLDPVTPFKTVVETISAKLEKMNNLYLLAVVDPGEMGISGFKQLEETKRDLEKSTFKVCRELRRRGYSCTYEVTVGETSKELLKLSDKHELDTVAFISKYKRRHVKGKRGKFVELMKKVKTLHLTPVS